ncbi:hypothetical protein K438DRAFT_2009333 [Mycena galopus ATCC 62051]|nr:hypothetical protein K438DRAFT_2009333 [Mycena galopus ATCC 62051]
MAVPIQQLAVHLQNTVTHLQLASGSLNTIAAAPTPNLGGTPQWALDMIHENKWEFYVMKIMNYNSSVDLQEQLAWSLARNQNATLNHDVLHLAPICLPLQRLAVPAIPAPPVPGAPANPPPIFVRPAPGPAPAAHASFPVTLGDLRTLTLADLALLFPAYNIPQPNGLVAVQRAEFARHVGVPESRLTRCCSRIGTAADVLFISSPSREHAMHSGRIHNAFDGPQIFEFDFPSCPERVFALPYVVTAATVVQFNSPSLPWAAIGAGHDASPTPNGRKCR